jgi:hypothetical protein
VKLKPNAESPKSVIPRGLDPPGSSPVRARESSVDQVVNELGRLLLESSLSYQKYPLFNLESGVSRLASPIPDVSTFCAELSTVDKDLLSVLPSLVKKVEFTGVSRRLTLGSLHNFVMAEMVKVTMHDGTNLMALDNKQKDQRPGFNTNCFGFALTQGKFWVEVRPMTQWLNNQKLLLKCEQGETPEKGDLLVWKDGYGETAHAAIALKSDSVVMAAGTHLYEDGKQYTIESLGNAWRNSGGKGTFEIWRATEQPNIS